MCHLVTPTPERLSVHSILWPLRPARRVLGNEAFCVIDPGVLWDYSAAFPFLNRGSSPVCAPYSPRSPRDAQACRDRSSLPALIMGHNVNEIMPGSGAPAIPQTAFVGLGPGLWPLTALFCALESVPYFLIQGLLVLSQKETKRQKLMK